jgi:hypothetical protein
MFENRAPKSIFVPKRNELAGDWRKLHNETLRDLYCSPNIRPVKAIKSRKRMLARHTGVLFGKPERKRSLGIRTRRWKNNIKIHFEEGLEGVDWIHLIQDREK